MILRQVFFQGLGLAARKGLLALSFLLMARALGPRVFGDFSYVYTWVYIFALLAGLGFSPVSTREVARRREHAPQLLLCALWLRLGASLMAAGLLAAFAAWGRWLPAETRTTAWLLAGTIPPLALADQMAAHLMGFGRQRAFALLNCVQWGLYLVATAAGLASGRGLEAIVDLQLAASWISLLVLGFGFRRMLAGAWAQHFDVPRARHLLAQAAPLALCNLLGVLYFRLGTLQLFHFKGAEQTGIYTSALQIVEALQLIPMAVTGAMFPAVCRAAGNRRELSRLLQTSVVVLAFFALFAGATFSAISPRLVPQFFGPAYAATGELLRTLIWAATPTFLHYNLAYFLIALHRQGWVTANALAGAGISFVANLLLVPRLGAYGAAYGTLITESSILVLHGVLLWPHVSVSRGLWPVMVPAAGALLVVAAGARWSTTINGSLGGLAGFALASCLLFVTSFCLCRRWGANWQTI